MLHAREIQSEYWLMKQMSLFIGIGKILSQEHWDATDGELEAGSEVSFVGLDGKYCWAEVEQLIDAAGSVYQVTDEVGNKHQCSRSELRARVWFTVAQTGVTNDQHHDSYATQHFTNQFLDQWRKDHDITSVHIHSDNAGSHFKNGRTLNYLSRLKDRLGCTTTWSFGCPGHGKGPWDGFGGCLKRVLRRDTIDQNIVIADFMTAAEHLRSRFCTDDWQEKHGLESNYTINLVQVFTAHTRDIDRKSEEVYDSVQGIRKSFGYCALSDGRVLQRWFDCWCSQCRGSLAPGEGNMDSNYRVAGCVSCEPWWEHSVALQGSRGIGAAKVAAQKKGRELASKLKPGTVIAVQDREVQNYTLPFLIGITQDAGNGSCIVEQVLQSKCV